MTDLGTLGGTIGFAQGANNRGQIIGQSNLAGDLTFHSFFSDQGVLTDLGTLGGDNVSANWLNDEGETVGRSDTTTPGIFGAFRWKNGTMSALGRVGTDPCSNARAINSHEQIVGSGSDCSYPLHAFLWENGGPSVDLNTLVSEGPDFQVLIAYNINERGEIAGTGVPAGCNNIDSCGHLFLLVPCDDRHPGQCHDYSMVEIPETDALAPSSPAKFNPEFRPSVPRLDKINNRFMTRGRLSPPPETHE
jgi:probable HAF family extracellular repeat protein